MAFFHIPIIDLSDHVPLTLELTAKPRHKKFNDLFSDFLIDKLNELSDDTKKRFADTITDLIEKAKKTDNLNDSIEHIPKRKQLIEKYDKLFEVDKLIKKLNNVC